MGVKSCRGRLTYQAGFAHPLGGAVALVGVHQVLAGASVVARVRSAVVNVWVEGIRFQSFGGGAHDSHSLSVSLPTVQEGPLQPGAHWHS